jgi:hypothetical protein
MATTVSSTSPAGRFHTTASPTRASASAKARGENQLILL